MMTQVGKVSNYTLSSLGTLFGENIKAQLPRPEG